MGLTTLIEKKRDKILNSWIESTLSSYPADAIKFLKKNDPFNNPVGNRIRSGLAGILDVVAGKKENEEAMTFLDDIVRVRAVQDFAPSAAVAFLFSLKEILRKELKKEAGKLEESADWQAVDRKIDALALLGFDAYNACRQKIFDIRVEEVKNLSYRTFRRANLVCDMDELPRHPETEEGSR